MPILLSIWACAIWGTLFPAERGRDRPAAAGSAKPFDRQFIDMMVPNHQGAIRMARVELKRGKNTHLREIASAIVKAQAKEIREMNAWRTDWYGAPSPSGGVPKG